MTTASTSAEAITISATGTDASIGMTGTTFFNDGVGLGRFTGAGSFVNQPVLRFFTQGLLRMFPGLCDSTPGSTAENASCTFGQKYGSATLCSYKAGCYYHLVSSGIAAPASNGGSWFANDQHKVMVDPPTVFDVSGNAAPPLNSGVPNNGAGSANSPLAWLGSAKVVSNQLYVMIKVYNLRQYSAETPPGSTTIQNSDVFSFTYLVITHRCHGAAASTTVACMSGLKSKTLGSWSHQSFAGLKFFQTRPS